MEGMGLLKRRTSAIYPERLRLDTLQSRRGVPACWVAPPLKSDLPRRKPRKTTSDLDASTNSDTPHTYTATDSDTDTGHESDTGSDSAANAMDRDTGKQVTGRAKDARSSKTDLYSGVANTSMIPSSENQQFIHGRIRHLVRRFTERAHRMRQRIEIPPTPSTMSSSDTEASPATRSRSIAPGGSQVQTTPGTPYGCTVFCDNLKPQRVLDPQGYFYIGWLFIVTICYTYNIWVIPLRSAFPFQTDDNLHIWMCFDYVSDLVYLIDVALIRPRVMYLNEGFWVTDVSMTRKNYMRTLQFKLDILSLLPLDLLYFYFGTKYVILRAPRMLKIQAFWEFYKLLDRVAASPHFLRVFRTLTYMLYMIHLNACAYYAYSAWEGLGSNRWVFSGKGHPYVRCFAFATKTATSIGKNPKPDNEGEYIFMTAAWLMGVFVFAILIGQIRDIIATATRSQSEYRKLVDETLEYMRRLKVPQDIQRRVNTWFTYTWEQQHTLDEGPILDSLPPNLKTDVAINVHIQTLGKVRLFADCDEALLRELVLKLRSVIYLPGDHVCRKGEVGREMYIVKTGQVQVFGGNNEVLATLSEGSVFGEISLLAINNSESANRRTADVKSRGFSNLFVLDKNDLNDALKHYPDAEEILRKKAKSLMKKNAAREKEENAKLRTLPEPEVVIHNRTDPEIQPKLLQAVIQALPEDSRASQLLRHGSKRANNFFKPRSNQIGVLDAVCNHVSDYDMGITISPDNEGLHSVVVHRHSSSEPTLTTENFGGVPRTNANIHKSNEFNVTVHREM